MKVVIEIDIDGDSFADDAQEEVKRVLRELINADFGIVLADPENWDRKLSDSNGNLCGVLKCLDR